MDDSMSFESALWARNARQAQTIADLQAQRDHAEHCRQSFEARIAELEADLAELRGEFTDLDDVRDDAEARLAAVLAVCDNPPTISRMLIPIVRAAATGDQQ